MELPDAIAFAYAAGLSMSRPMRGDEIEVEDKIAALRIVFIVTKYTLLHS